MLGRECGVCEVGLAVAFRGLGVFWALGRVMIGYLAVVLVITVELAFWTICR